MSTREVGLRVLTLEELRLLLWLADVGFLRYTTMMSYKSRSSYVPKTRTYGTSYSKRRSLLELDGDIYRATLYSDDLSDFTERVRRLAMMVGLEFVNYCAPSTWSELVEHTRRTSDIAPKLSLELPGLNLMNEEIEEDKVQEQTLNRSERLSNWEAVKELSQTVDSGAGVSIASPSRPTSNSSSHQELGKRKSMPTGDSQAQERPVKRIKKLGMTHGGMMPPLELSGSTDTKGKQIASSTSSAEAFRSQPGFE